MGQGATVEEALESVVDAIQGVVAARMEDNLRSLNLGNTRIETSARIVEIPL
jgi:predicted RNase H-like HicB family nuclease